MFWIIFMTVAGIEDIQWHKAKFEGYLGKTQSDFIKVDLLGQPLLYLSVKITLEDLDGDLPEYPKPKPVAYGRIDGVPNEHHFDYYLELNSKSGNLVQEQFPNNGQMIIIRIDGGLLDELHYFNAYGVDGWYYTIHLKAAYCPSGMFTVLPWVYDMKLKYCDVPVGNYFGGDFDEFNGFVGKLIFVPAMTELMTVETDASYTIKFNNFGNEFKTGSFEIKFPNQGWWYILLNSSHLSSFSINQHPCSIGHISSCLNETINYIPHVSTHSNLPSSLSPSLSSNSSILHMPVPILEEDLKYRYAIIISQIDPAQTNLSYSFGNINNTIPLCVKNSKNYCKISSKKIVAEIEYPKLGNLFINIQTEVLNVYDLSVFRTKTGDHMCNGQEANNTGIVFYCLCEENSAGFYCEKDAISDSKYMTSIMFLTLSNLTMIFALIYGYRIGAYVEITAFFSNMVASYLYHWCDEQYYCFGFMYYALHVADFILSFYSICVSIIYLTKIPLYPIKFSILLGILVGLIYLGLGTGFNAFVSSILPLLIIGFFTIARYSVFVYQNSKKAFGKFKIQAFYVFFVKSENFRLKWVGLAGISLAAALVSRAFELNYNYYITHSLWHVFVMLSAFCVLRSIYYEKQGFEFRVHQDIELNIRLNNIDPIIQ